MEYAADGTCCDCRFLETNALFEVHTGLKNAQGRTALELVPTLERFWIEKYSQVALSRQPDRFEHTSEAMGRSFDVHAFPVGHPAERLVGVLFTDSTERRRAEHHEAFLKAVAADFERLGTLDEIMGAVGVRLGEHLGITRCLFCEIDEAKGTVTSPFGWVRAGEPPLVHTLRMADYMSPALLSGRSKHRPVVVEDVSADLDLAEGDTPALNIWSYVMVPRRLDGSWSHYLTVADSRPRKWRDDELELLQSFTGLVFSRLQRARDEAALRASEQRFRTMADAAPQIIWTADASGQLEFVNRQWSRYTGLDRAPADVCEMADRAFHPEDVQAALAQFDEARASRSTYRAEHRIRSACGEYRWFLVRAEPERDAITGDVQRWIGMSVDIHDRRMAEQARAEADSRKDQFLATLAHELRNPLAPIRTGLSVLRAQPDAAVAARTHDVMERQLGHMVRLIDDLLDISRINSNKIELRKQPVDLRTVIEEAIEATLPGIEAAGHRVILPRGAESIVVEADRTRLVQVFGNLLSNAAKYTPSNGRIEISTRVVQDQAVIQVRDNGVGIDASALGDVFDLFSQVSSSLDRAQGGLGIGLALVKRLVVMHGGTVAVDSAGLGRGSVFTVTLPTSRVQPEAAAGPRPARAADPPSQALDILVVDDNEDAVEMMCAALEMEGYPVRAAYSGADALATLEEAPPDVMFLDIGLPGMDGYQVARRIRALPDGDRVTLVALTGWGSEADRARAIECGFDHHFTKPVDFVQVSTLLKTLGARAHA